MNIGAGPGPKAESGRLLAGILKNCQSKKAMRNVINMGGLPSVTVMLHSSHARMLNEAIVALTTLTASLAASSVTSSMASSMASSEAASSVEDAADQTLIHRHLHTDLVINGVIKCLNNSDLPAGLHANGATFIKALLKIETEAFKQMLNDMTFVQQCKCFDDPEKLSSLPKEVQELFAVFKK